MSLFITAIVAHRLNRVIIREPEVAFEGLNIPEPVAKALLDTIARRLTPQAIKLRADIELTCFKPAGIEAIKKALRAGEAMSTVAVPVKAKLVAPPFYVLVTNSTDKVGVPGPYAPVFRPIISYPS